MSEQPENLKSRTEIPPETELANEHESLYNKFFERKEYESTSKGTRKTGVRDWLHWCESNDITAGAAQKADVHRYIDERKADGLATQSLVSRYNSVSIFYVYLISRNHLDRNDNPCELINLKKEHDIKQSKTKQVTVIVKNNRSTDSSKQLLALAPDDIETIIDHLPQPRIRNEAAVRLAYECGLRPVEVQRLQIGDVNREERHIIVDSAKITDTDDDLYFRDQWFSEDSRLNYLLYRWMEEERDDYKFSKEYEQANSKAKEKLRPKESLFATDQKPYFRSSYLSRKIKEAAQDAGLNEPLYTDGNGNTRWLISGHTMRISYITHMCNQTPTPVPVIAKLVGHKKIQTTFEYVDSDPDTLQDYQEQYSP